MFRSCTLLSIFSILLLGSLWIIHLATEESTAFSAPEAPIFAVAEGTQIRSQVRKDLWIAEANGERLQNRIESDSSLLILKPRKTGSLEVIEELTGVRCWLQEKIQPLEKTQQIRFLIAKEGIYLYKDQKFEAQNVKLSLYKMPGKILPFNLENYKPFLKGSAENILFSLENKGPCFTATQFKASSS